MADQTRKDPKQSPETKDLPPRKGGKSDEGNVKGGAIPLNPRPKPFDPNNG